MKPVLTAKEMQAAEEALFAAQPEVDLMARAAEAVARIADEVAEPGPILVVAGRGNNGGDALFAAAHLAASRPIRLWLPFGSAHGAGLRAAEEAGCLRVDPISAVASLAEVALVIDGLAGLGGRAGLTGSVATFAQACLATATAVLSVDLPSGLEADDSLAPPSFQASHTVTFAAFKHCHVQQPAASRCGTVHVVDIGVEVPQTALRQAEPADIARAWPMPDRDSDKYSRGVVALDTGSETYPGAGILSVSGALHGGAGLVRYIGGTPPDLLLGRFPSVVMGHGRAQAMVLGSGWGAVEAPEAHVASALLQGVPAVVDADALYCLPASRLEGWLLTPHAGELARLLGCSRSQVEAQPLVCAREMARALGAAVLLKGATQYVAEPSGRVSIAVPGPGWTATAGSGDVLAGICGALLAAGLPAWQAGLLGASIQAMTAARFPGPRTPDELAALLPGVVADLRPEFFTAFPHQ